jgi:hypothetical protein
MGCSIPVNMRSAEKTTIQRIFSLLGGGNPLGELGKTPIFAALQGVGPDELFQPPNDRKDPSCSFNNLSSCYGRRKMMVR